MKMFAEITGFVQVVSELGQCCKYYYSNHQGAPLKATARRFLSRRLEVRVVGANTRAQLFHRSSVHSIDHLSINTGDWFDAEEPVWNGYRAYRISIIVHCGDRERWLKGSDFTTTKRRGLLWGRPRAVGDVNCRTFGLLILTTVCFVAYRIWTNTSLVR